MENQKDVTIEIQLLRNEINRLNHRISKIEASLGLQKSKQTGRESTVLNDTEQGFELNLTTKTDESIEFRIGEYGMAWFGNIVLLFGIAFLIQYLQNSGNQLIGTLAGLVAISGIYAICYYSQNAYSYLSKLFAYNGHFLLFYWTLRLHFFQENPLIKDESLALFLILICIGGLFYRAYIRQSQLMAGMVFLMILFSGIIINSIHFAPAMIFLVALLSMGLYYKFGWLRLVFVFIFLSYFAYFNFILNNPLGGNSPEFIQSPGLTYLYFIGSGFVLSLLAILPKKENISDDFLISAIVWNGLGFSAVLAITTITYLSEGYVPVFAAISVFCLVFSVILQAKASLKIVASMYALYGFLAMSVAFYGLLKLPEVYMLFALQSLLVVSMALWFGSRFIVVMNSILFVLLLIFYLVNKPDYNSVNFSFMLVALITARIINWKKERLQIKTELIRNIYLSAGFVMTLIAFYHAFPPSYTTVSWIGAALLFFLIGRLLGNIKYRWLAIASLISSGVKLIFTDLSDLDIGLRVVIFLLLAVISIAVSVLYTKFLIRKKE